MLCYITYATCRYYIPSRGAEQITVLPDADAGTLSRCFDLPDLQASSVEVSNLVNMDFDFFVFRKNFADAMTKTIRSA